MSAGSAKLNPRVTVKNEKGKTVRLPDSDAFARYSLRAGSIISVNKGDEIEPATVVGKIPREAFKTKDITGGLPRAIFFFYSDLLFEY